MITETNVRGVQNGKKLVSLALKSTDSKPTEGVMNGSTCIEVNTGKTYVYDEEGSEWTEISSSGGGGGGGGSSDFSTAEVTFICDGGEGYNFLIIGGYVIYNNEALIPTQVYPIQVDYYENVTVEIPLYKGEILIPVACFDNTGENLPVCTGDIVFDQSGFTISGDGTITIQGGEAF